jgi:diguanylate cyclase (GGDEF)-like protein/PAS domain S-box-containing protein
MQYLQKANLDPTLCCNGIDSMAIRPTNLLLIENDPVDARLIQTALATKGDNLFTVEWVTSLAAALERISKGEIEVIMLDLALPDGKGLDVLDKVFAAAPDSLVLVLSATTDDEVIHQAIERGAHDYFAKGHIDAHWLPRALNYVIERKKSRSALTNSETRFRAMSDASPLGIFVSDEQGSCIYTNAAYHTISGQTLEETLGTNWTAAIHPEDRTRAIADWGNAVRNQAPFLAEVRFVRKDKTVVWTRLNAGAMREANTDSTHKNLSGYVQIVEDISDRKAMELIVRVSEEALFEQQERAQVTLNSIGDGVLTTNLAGKVSYLNHVAEAMTGWSMKEALGLPLADVFTVIDADTRDITNPIKRALKENKTIKLPANSLLVRRDGTEAAIEDSIAPIHNRNNEVIGAVIVFHDVTATRAMAEKMMHMAQHDSLTGLPNRTLLIERLTRAIGLASRKKKQLALLFLDVDNFKKINDSLGHSIGDKLLQSVSKRIQDVVRTTDTVCRQGGDEFVVLLTEIEHRNDAAQVAEKIIAAFASPHVIDGNTLNVTVSIGVSVYPDDGSDVETTFQHADTAMYHAKTSGRNNYQFFRTDMKTHSFSAIKTG